MTEGEARGAGMEAGRDPGPGPGPAAAVGAPDGAEGAAPAARPARRATVRQRAEQARARLGQPSALVHIGLNKAGSSTIQAWLALNRRSLRRKGLVYDPLRAEGDAEFTMLHGYYAAAFVGTKAWRKDRKLKRFFGVRSDQDLREKVDRFTLRAEELFRSEPEALHVISSEMIADRLRTPRLVRQLDLWLRERLGRVEYVVYLRDQVDWLASAYAESITQGNDKTMEEFIQSHGETNYDLLVRRWSDSVGEGRLHVRLLEPDALTQGDLVLDFADFLGVDPHGMMRPGRANEALPASRLRALRLSNQVGKFLERFKVKDARTRLARLTAPFDRGPKLKLTDEQALRVARLNAASNEALRARLFPERPTLFAKSGRILAGASPSPTP